MRSIKSSTKLLDAFGTAQTLCGKPSFQRKKSVAVTLLAPIFLVAVPPCPVALASPKFEESSEREHFKVFYHTGYEEEQIDY